MKKLLSLFFSTLSLFAIAQNKDSIIHRVEFRIDTNLYIYPTDAILYQGENTLFFTASGKTALAEVTIYTGQENKVQDINLASSEDYELVDSIIKISDKFFRGKFRLNNITSNPFTRIRFNLTLEDRSRAEEIKLSPSFKPEISVPFEQLELYMGEERVIELPVTNGVNLAAMNNYLSIDGLRFKVGAESDKIRLFIQPEGSGDKELVLNLKTNRPYLNEQNKLTNEIPPVKVRFTTRPGRLHFINFDKTDFFWDPGLSNAEEIQIEYNRGFEINKTYRIENQQKPGGRLIAELFTVNMVGNNKILAWLRPYTLHRTMEGYLFVKDGDEAKFITNFNILQRPTIQQISILREGQDWTNNLSVHPGEKIELKIEGKGLSKAEFRFEGVKDFQLDTSRTSDNIQFYQLKIPVEITEKRISVYMNKTITSYEMLVREYQFPRELDFIKVSYASEQISLSSDIFNKPVLYRTTIPDVNILFDRTKIDSKNRLYGKQYLTIEVKTYNNRNDLIEFQKIENIVICPGENSPRFAFYDLKDCRNNAINLNDYLLHKTYDLDGWYKLEIRISHNDQKYGLPGYSKKLTFIKEKRTTFDLQISFPTGLLVKRFDQSGFGNLTGISTAFLAQFSFYDKQKVGKLKPYKLGAGFIALDVFNVNNQQRDMGLIVLGSLLPFRKDAKFTFPLYIGAGYLIKSNSVFTVFGPGVQFNF